MIKACLLIALLLSPHIAEAQTLDLDQLIPEDEGTFTGRIIQGIVLLTLLSLAPGILVTTTCFTRFIIAFSFLRSGLGLQSTPSNLIVISLALFMTYFVMAPVFEQSWRTGVAPLLDREIDRDEAIPLIIEPLKEFMQSNVKQGEVDLFAEFAGDDIGDAAEELRILIPAFLLSEIRRGFEIGFLILLPFLIIDLVVATATMAMGMMMLPPTVVSMPFKILFFVLIDGWSIIVGELLKSVA